MNRYKYLAIFFFSLDVLTGCKADISSNRDAMSETLMNEIESNESKSLSDAENSYDEQADQCNDKNYWDDLCKFINHIYNYYRYYSLAGDGVWHNREDLLSKTLQVYFNSSESKKRDLNTVLPFVKYFTSEDNRLSVYSWEMSDGGTFIPYASIVQYVISEYSEDVKSLTIRELSEIADAEYEYSSIIKLKDNNYLLYGSARTSSFTYGDCFIAVKFEKEDYRFKLVPSPIFNNSPIFSQSAELVRRFPQKMVIRKIESVFDEKEQKIIATYDEVIDDKKEIDPSNENNNLKFNKLEFVYNGTKFIGNYDKLTSIDNSYWIK